MSSKVSFTIRRPTPVSRATSSGPDSDAGSSFKVPPLPRHIATNGDPALGSPLARSATSSPFPEPSQEDQANDSSDEDSVSEDELVTGFDKFGVQRLKGEKKVNKPLVIPALKNKDWRELARKRRGGAQYVPPSATAEIGKDGSVGGLGTRDTINSGPMLSGLQVKKRIITAADDGYEFVQETEDVTMEVVEEESEDQKALRAILAESSGEVEHDGRIVDIIPPPISEADALKQDVEELPDVATLEDYARIPVSQFGAALLRGMGWKEGTAASRKPGKGLVEPYLPTARPALLGIGAKEQEVYDDGSKKSKGRRRDGPYVPIMKQERTESRDKRERSRSPRRSAATSRRNSPDRHGKHSEKNGDSVLRYDSDRDREREARRGEDRDRRRDDDRDRDRRRGNDRNRRRDDGRDRSEHKRERS